MHIHTHTYSHLDAVLAIYWLCLVSKKKQESPEETHATHSEHAMNTQNSHMQVIQAHDWTRDSGAKRYLSYASSFTNIIYIVYSFDKLQKTKGEFTLNNMLAALLTETLHRHCAVKQHLMLLSLKTGSCK